MITEDKKELRLKIRQQTAKLNEEDKRMQSCRVFDAVEQTEQFRSAKTIGMFWSLDDELPTHQIVEKWAKEKCIALPRISEGEMEFVEFVPGCEMVEGSLKVRCPQNGAVISPEEIDLIIIPGVAFDEEGNRLGRGKGYYDKFLAKTKAFRMGVCMSHQKVGKVPSEEHDQQTNILITP